ncbi:hypothetical protein B0H13DRAFT_2300752 [Mycena leptocephala]|nr:hypothetical protein B0H13DRAFT_2300752 [Mycena leptocephala]
MTAVLEYDDIQSNEYLDIVNLDRFDVIVGTKFLRKHKISLDFEFNTIWVAGVPSSTLTEKEENGEVERRNALNNDVRRREIISPRLHRPKSDAMDVDAAVTSSSKRGREADDKRRAGESPGANGKRAREIPEEEPCASCKGYLQPMVTGVLGNDKSLSAAINIDCARNARTADVARFTGELAVTQRTLDEANIRIDKMTLGLLDLTARCTIAENEYDFLYRDRERALDQLDDARKRFPHGECRRANT